MERGRKEGHVDWNSLSTRLGHKIRIYCNDGMAPNSVHGAYLSKHGWILCAWREDGSFIGDGKTSDLDLIKNDKK